MAIYLSLWQNKLDSPVLLDLLGNLSSSSYVGYEMMKEFGSLARISVQLLQDPK